MTDEQWMKQLQRGRVHALDALYERYARKLHVFCTRALGVRHAEDVVHDVFLRVIEAADQFDPRKASFRTWLFGIARNRGIDFLRREQAVRVSSLEGEAGDPDRAPDPIDAGGPAPIEAALQSDLVAAVRGCLEELDREEERQALVLYYVGDRVFREIGRMLGKSTSAAQKWVHAAREQVKRCLERKGIES